MGNGFLKLNNWVMRPLISFQKESWTVMEFWCLLPERQLSGLLQKVKHRLQHLISTQTTVHTGIYTTVLGEAGAISPRLAGGKDGGAQRV